MKRGILIFGLLCLVAGCGAEKNHPDEGASLKQKQADLLEGQVMAVAYSGFRDGQHPDRGTGAKVSSDEEILEDLTILGRDSNFRLIRLYDSKRNSQDVLRVIREHDLAFKVMLGVWLSAEFSNHEGCSWLTEPIPQAELDANKITNQAEVEKAIELAREYKEIIVAVNVGNEALVNWADHTVPVEAVISYVKQVKGAIDQPVTVADNYKWWAESGADLARELDFIGLHVYPVWEEKDIEEGMSYTIANVQEVVDALPEAKIVITEAGWASVASEFGERASEEKQKRYCEDLIAWADEMNITTFLFEAFDESWKGNPDNPLGAEKHWGLFTVDRKAKLIMQEKYPDLAP
jgi:exo-beta-1,3-glucanase (GH17 family)